VKARTGDVVRLPRDVREVIANAIVRPLGDAGYKVLAVSVVSDHVHIVVELPDDPRQIKAIIGDAKRRASRAIKRTHPGAVWSAGCDYEPLDDRHRVRSEVEYVLFKQGADAWTWSFRDGAGGARSD
jgi:REP element-mobilizing transposase RayT